VLCHQQVIAEEDQINLRVVLTPLHYIDMKDLLINKVEYQIPSGWEDLTLQQYLEAMAIPSGMTLANKKIKNIHIMSKIPVNVLREMNTYDINQIMNLLQFIGKGLSGIPKSDIDYFDFKGEAYFVEPVGSSLFGAYIDYEHYLEVHGAIQALPWLMAIVCRKRDEKYGDYDVHERAEEFRDLPFLLVHNVSAFFLINYQLSNVISMLTLKQKEQLQALTESTENLLKSMAGKGSYLKRLRIEMLQKLMVYYQQKQSL
jgi:hypothetical protein